ncbi:MAG: YdcH family protein [Aquabacterium sp.]
MNATTPDDAGLHSVQRRLIELRMEHSDLDEMIDRIAVEPPLDELAMRRLKKRRLMLRDEIARLEADSCPPEPA